MVINGNSDYSVSNLLAGNLHLLKIQLVAPETDLIQSGFESMQRTNMIPQTSVIL